ncbi:response regulator [Clostridium saccharobutylicum]|uniref:Stage 0 sporulation protein A homolog n=1 Tax=Clostridium saccharobutylicum DSM 13864 TaxID=1345695 RepID=U5MRA0_CLOSA|nr:response regulator [Clostridium saccharobutylicum]AGX43028.1 chemotaxis protein CheY [Clostridium saccharobutylicum DSM 13864]AQR90319.1 chemotaxis protein CheY [Clostridium saccharobutylicum]AQS00225.1 chemotaxis protein CheY [Clostridium saccharobutylicum]AQS14208.1 chemotaxis protein CheY [Clostridium saccharobutylicum]MBA2905359.1 two-component system chemotaxis response regulator CheY [Clostridium saccharobutylicum]
MDNKCKILIVDDSPMIHALIKRALENDEFTICGSGKNGKDGVEKYKELSPDIVTMDITMPVMDGLEASKEIMSINPKAKIVMLSAMGDEEIIETANQIGINYIIKKPFNKEELLDVLKKVLED